MKKQFFTLTLCMAAAFGAQATIIHVDNNPNSPAPYTSVQDAIDNATTGDTIYVMGSLTSYGSITVDDKAVHIVGSGYEPSKQFPNPTTFSSVTFTWNNPGGGLPPTFASGSSIEGCALSGGNSIRINGGGVGSRVGDIVIKRCKLENNLLVIYATSILVVNNRLDFANFQYTTNAIISNNIIEDDHAYYSNSTNILYSHNLFINRGTGFILNSPQNTLFENNIFISEDLFTGSAGNCVYNNNIFYCLNNTLPSAGSNTFSNNIVGSDPTFVNAPGMNQPSIYDFNDTHNYNLDTGSPGLGAGTNGEDIGIYGGTYAWPEGGADGSGFMYSQEANIPQVNQMNALNSSVPLNGTLNVNVMGIINP